MGMAASQARLLMITARLHDIEYKAQNIQNEKIMLATQSDEIYKKFNAALEKYELAISGGSGNNPHTVQANFNNMTGPNAIDTGEHYIFYEAKSGHVIVPDKIAKAYEKFANGNSKDFATSLGGNEETQKYNTQLFEKIKEAGGCISIASYNGPDGDAANDSDFIYDMIQKGEVYIKKFGDDQKETTATSPTVNPSIGGVPSTESDKTELLKAQAEYENESKKINNKEKKFDMDLSKLETERTALTTEYDSIKKVVDDNIERTFGIFS